MNGEEVNWLRLIERRTNGLRPAARQERNPTKEMEMKFLLWKELRELIAGVSPAGPGRFAMVTHSFNSNQPPTQHKPKKFGFVDWFVELDCWIEWKTD